MERSDPTTALAAMGQETRYAAMRLLVTGDPDGIGAGDLARTLGVAPSALSFHMNALTHAGLVASERRGRAILYRADREAVAALLATLDGDLST